jgi:hypothetical protein
MSGWGRHGTNKSNLEEFPGPLTEFHKIFKIATVFFAIWPICMRGNVSAGLFYGRAC